MKRLILAMFVIMWITASLFTAVPTALAQVDAAPLILQLQAEGQVTPLMVDYINRGIDTASTRSADVIILQLNTPGGSIDLMNRIVQKMRASTIPIIVYVAPNGAMAGSAGTIITLAGHLAAMAPETMIGAASPVDDQGQDIGETMENKIKNAMKATARSLASRRSPEAVKLAEDTIENARAVSAQEALAAGLIDLIARDTAELLQAADGKTVFVQDAGVVLNTRNARVETLPNSFIEQLLGLLANPNLVFLLFTIGIQAILIELSSPGGWVAGFIGVVCVALAVYGMGFLPVNWFGFIFLVIAFVLFILDIKAPTHGALTVAGVGSFILGALVLFNSPGVPEFQRVSVPLVIGTGIFTAASFFAILTIALKAQKAPIRMGREAMVGKSGITRSALDPDGSVYLGGELWTAQIEEGAQAIPTATRVTVVAVEGLRLIVRKSG